MIAKITKRKSAFTLAEGGRRPLLNLCQCRTAFTLAEVLITLSVIGIVAALTIPSMIENHNNKAWQTAKDLWDKKLVEATRQMNIDGVMTGVANSTEDYMNYFKKYVKVIKICDNSKLSDCYAAKIIKTENKEVKVNDIVTSEELGKKDWNTNTIGFVIADGTTVIMAYNPNCSSVDPFSNAGQNGQLGCMSMLIDVNGKKGPNKTGDDIDLINAVISTCDLKIGDKCIAAGNFYPEPINTCVGSENEVWDNRPYNTTSCASNYWAGAKKACSENGMRLPSKQEMADIATYIYNVEDKPIEVVRNMSTGDGKYRRNLTSDEERVAELNWSVNSTEYWVNAPETIGNPPNIFRAYSFTFYRTWIAWGTLGLSYSGCLARCVK